MLILCQRVDHHLAARCTSADRRYLEIEVDPCLGDQRRITERVPGGVDVCRLPDHDLPLAVVAEASGFEDEGQSDRGSSSIEVCPAIDRPVIGHRDIEFGKQAFLEKPVLGMVQSSNRRIDGHLPGDLPQRADGYVLELVGQDVATGSELPECPQVVEGRGHDLAGGSCWWID